MASECSNFTSHSIDKHVFFFGWLLSEVNLPAACVFYQHLVWWLVLLLCSGLHLCHEITPKTNKLSVYLLMASLPNVSYSGFKKEHTGGFSGFSPFCMNHRHCALLLTSLQTVLLWFTSLNAF